MLKIENVSFSYARAGDSSILRNVSFDVERNEFVAIQGPSGSGKSTLFYILGCMLRPTDGRVILDGQETTFLSDQALAVIRNRKIGFIFQQFHLLPRANVLENILMPSHYSSEIANSTKLYRERALDLAKKMGLDHRLCHLPNELSGGEQQRVAIARALMNDVDVLLADEPTGNLDTANSSAILSIFQELHALGKTIVLITHDRDVASKCQNVFQFKDGTFVNSTAACIPKACLPPRVAPDSSPSSPGLRAHAKITSRLGHRISGSPLNAAHSQNPRHIDGYASDFAPSDRSNRTPTCAPKREVIFAWALTGFARMFRTNLPLAVQNLRRNKTRALLNMIGVTVGIASVMAMITFGEFTKSKILKGYEDLGVNKIVIHGWPNWNLQAKDQVKVLFRHFNWEKDIAPLHRIFPQIWLSSPILHSWGDTVYFGGLTISENTQAIGVNADYAAISNRSLQIGRWISPHHIDNQNPVCVVGSDIAAKLFRQVPPLGNILFIAGSRRPPYPCKVIGVLTPQASNIDWRKPNLEVIMPHTYFSSVNNYWHSALHSFAVRMRTGADVEKISKGIKNYLRQKYGKSGEFIVGADAILIAQMRKFLSMFGVLLIAIALIALGVGGMGINNLMLVSLSERFKEIGIRKAVGATNESIRHQFLIESILLCAIAGCLGIVIGFSSYEIIIYVTSKFVPKLQFEWVLEPMAILTSLGAILLVGIASGIVPALKAEKLQVIEALRSE